MQAAQFSADAPPPPRQYSDARHTRRSADFQPLAGVLRAPVAASWARREAGGRSATVTRDRPSGQKRHSLLCSNDAMWRKAIAMRDAIGLRVNRQLQHR